MGWNRAAVMIAQRWWYHLHHIRLREATAAALGQSCHRVYWRTITASPKTRGAVNIVVRIFWQFLHRTEVSWCGLLHMNVALLVASSLSCPADASRFMVQSPSASLDSFLLSLMCPESHVEKKKNRKCRCETFNISRYVREGRTCP